MWPRSSFTLHGGHRVGRAKSSSLRSSTMTERRTHSARRTSASSEELLAFGLLDRSRLVALRDGGAGEHVQRLLQLLVGDHEGQEMPQDVVVDAAGRRD